MQLRKRLNCSRRLKYFFRAIGLEWIPSSIRERDAPEGPKPVLHTSFWTAFSRSTIHLIPCTVFAFLLYLNYNAVYLGPGFVTNQTDAFMLALFQVAAKLQEIVCVASLTTVVLHMLRHELIHHGVPLGFVGSGIYFSQVNRLWSPEMIIGLAHYFKNGRDIYQSWRRTGLSLLVALAALLAVLIAPSTAILLQPRLQNVPAGHPSYYIPATADQLWPSLLDGMEEPQECFDGNTSTQILCASGGYESLRDFFRVLNTSFTTPPLMLGSGSRFNPLIIKSSAPQIPDLQIHGSVRGWSGETVMHQPNMATSILPSRLREDWRRVAQDWSGSVFSAARQYKFAKRTLSIVSTINPVVRVRCTQAQNASTGSTKVLFPVSTWQPSNRGWVDWQDGEGNLKPFNITVLDPNTVDNMHIEWVPLPSESFGPVSGGIFLQYPRPGSEVTAAVVGCSVGAAWYQSEIESNSEIPGAAWFPTATRAEILSIRDDISASSHQAKDILRLITISNRWFESLNTISATQDAVDSSSPLTNLQQVFRDVGLSSLPVHRRTQPYFQYYLDDGLCWSEFRVPNLTLTDVERLHGGCSTSNDEARHHTHLTEFILATIIVNGLSRHGTRHYFQPESLDPKIDKFHWRLKAIPQAENITRDLIRNKRTKDPILPPPLSSDFVALHLRFEVYGYAWYASLASDYFATVVISIYIVVAVAHGVWILIINRKTSCSWDTVTELLALALQSPVATSLLGSGAGIERLNTYKRLVRLRALEAGEEKRDGASKRLVLVLETANGVGRGTDTIVEPDKKYL